MSRLEGDGRETPDSPIAGSSGSPRWTELCDAYPASLVSERMGLVAEEPGIAGDLVET